MLYEYRRYEVNPGKKPELDARFRDLTLPLWEKHGMKAVGLFDVEVGTMTNEFHYILAWESLAERERDRKSTRLNSSHLGISYAVFCLKKKKHTHITLDQ